MHLNLSAWFRESDFNHIIKAKRIFEWSLNSPESELWEVKQDVYLQCSSTSFSEDST